MKKAIAFIGFFAALQTMLWGQKITVNGSVSDEFNQPVIGANIMVKNTYLGTTTDLDGSFVLIAELTAEKAIVITYLGYEPYEKVLSSGPDNTVNIGTVKLKPSSTELEGVTITAGAFEASDEKRGTILNSLDIATTAGATADVAATLNTLPGTQRVGEEGRLFVRGGAAYETRTFIDGTVAQNPYNSSVSGVPSRGRYSPFLFSGTAFSTGGYSAEFGQALSSALVLNTHGLATKTQSEIGITTVGLDATHQKLWDNNTSLAVSANYMNLSPYTAIIDQNIDWVAPFQNYGSQVIYRKKTSENGILKIHGDFSETKMRLKYPNADDLKDPNDVSLRNNYGYLNASFKEIIKDTWTISGGMSYNFNKDYVQFDSINHQITDQLVQARVSASRFVGNVFKIKTGVEYYNQAYREKVNNKSDLNRDFNYLLHHTAAFAEVDIVFNSRLYARIGERFEYSSYVNEPTFSSRVSLAYRLSSNSQVSGAFGQFYQLPESRFLLYSSDLVNENALHYILNYQYSKDQRIFRIEGYYKDYGRLIRYNGDYRYEPWLLNNSGNGYARGIDVYFRDKKTFKDIDYWISYSFLDTERNFLNFRNEVTPGFASRHNLSIVYKHWIDKIDSQLGITYSFSSGRPYDDPASVLQNDKRTPAFHDLSANLSHLTQLWGHSTILFLSCTNILGFENIFGYRYGSSPDEEGNFSRIPVEPTAKRFAFIGLFITFEKKEVNNK
ncbi:MAG: TonB-dependent receptor [Saprospiraceae bacterium]|nr:TonB-dependent receptor [Saprospiraceae bacterium]MDZ4703050.1 TonB-dependent receptor [Saprospiraceae bacterium]